MGSALDRAHRQGIIHRDVKPGNIFFDDDSNAYLGDFGIVKIAEGSTTYTRSGGTLGTPAFMSPEQARADHPLDGRSDVYSLGVVFFQMLSGVLPYQADTPMGLAMKHVLDPVPRLEAFIANPPPGAQSIIDKAMAKQPADRYASAGELARAVQVLAAPAASPSATIHSKAFEKTGDVPQPRPVSEITPEQSPSGAPLPVEPGSVPATAALGTKFVPALPALVGTTNDHVADLKPAASPTRLKARALLWVLLGSSILVAISVVAVAAFIISQQTGQSAGVTVPPVVTDTAIVECSC